MALVVRDDRRFLREVETVRSFSYNYRLDQVDISSPPPLSDREIFWALVSDRRTLPSHSQLLRELPRAIDELERWERAGDEP